MKSVIFAIVLCLVCALSHTNAATGAQKIIPISDATKLLVYAPRPDYPAAARQKKLTGRAVVLVRVSSTGLVTSATLRQSAGSPILDGAAVAAVKRCRFRPGRSFAYEQPITYTKTGVSY